jgi:REP element-mobilizing transposase RayT
MAGTYSSLLFHVIFTTKDRRPLLKRESLQRLHEYLGGTVRGLGGVPLGVGGVEDHVHLLISLKPTHCISDFLRELKKASSKWVSETMKAERFHWQDGYSVFSVSASGKEDVVRYIANQEEHHRKKTFREELLFLLKRSGVVFDEKYLD